MANVLGTPAAGADASKAQREAARIAAEAKFPEFSGGGRYHGLAARQTGDYHPVAKGSVNWSLSYVGDSARDQKIIRDYPRGLMALWRRDMDSRAKFDDECHVHVFCDSRPLRFYGA